MEMNMASVASYSVAGMRSMMRCMADSPVRKLLPKSSWTALDRKMKYCSQRGRSRPRLRRMASRSRSVASGLAIISTGSPIRYRPANTRADMTRTTSPVCSRRRTMVAITLACSLCERHVLRQSHLIGATFIADIVLHGPDRHFELQRKNAVIFHDHVSSFFQQSGALVFFHCARRFQDQLVGFWVGVLAPVGRSQTLFRLLSDNQRIQRVEHFAGRRRPPSQIGTKGKGITLLEEHGRCHRIDVDLHTNA